MENRLKCSKTRKARRTSVCPLCRRHVSVGQVIGYVPLLAQWMHCQCLVPRTVETLKSL